ncbi:hypothetical protein DP49_6626 [Burkholderia pseudomallei]|nr:hypothetical protein DP49_6626 [Burkholderia pseudomallei]
MRAAQRVDRAIQAARAGARGGDRVGRYAQMLGEQALARARDRLAHARLAVGGEHDVALGVEHHRAVVQVRAADHEIVVVDAHQLAVHVHAQLAEAVDVRTQQPVAAVAVGVDERTMQPRAQHAHRRFLQPAALLARRDHDDVGRIVGREPRGERLAHDGRGEVLVLDVQVAARGRDRIRGQRTDVADFVAAAMARRRECDREGHVAHVHRRAGRPRIVVRRAPPVRADRDALAAGARPALARERADRGRRVAVEHRLHVVKRRVARAVRIDAARLVGRMPRRVPARARQIEAADERDAIVDHDELLVMRRAARVRAVEPEHDAVPRAPSGAVHGRPFALERVDHREIPCQHIDPQPSACVRERVQERRERLRPAVVRAVRHEPQPAVDVPADDEDRVARAPQRRAQRREIRVAVDERREALRVQQRVAVAAGFEQSAMRARFGGAVCPRVGRRRRGRRHVAGRPAERKRAAPRAGAGGAVPARQSRPSRCSSASQRARSACIGGPSASVAIRSPNRGANRLASPPAEAA